MSLSEVNKIWSCKPCMTQEEKEQWQRDWSFIKDIDSIKPHNWIKGQYMIKYR